MTSLASVRGATRPPAVITVLSSLRAWLLSQHYLD
jgi:hypothetical protein